MTAVPGVPMAVTRQAVHYRAAIAQVLFELRGDCTGCLKARHTLQQAVDLVGDEILQMRMEGLLNQMGQHREPPSVATAKGPPLIPEQRAGELTLAQTAVVKLVAQGLTLHEVARTQHVDISAVAKLLTRAKRRLGVTDRPGLLREAHRLGLI